MSIKISNLIPNKVKDFASRHAVLSGVIMNLIMITANKHGFSWNLALKFLVQDSI